MSTTITIEARIVVFIGAPRAAKHTRNRNSPTRSHTLRSTAGMRQPNSDNLNFALEDLQFQFPDIPRQKKTFFSGFEVLFCGGRLEIPVSRYFTGKEDLQFQFPNIPRQKKTFFSGFEVFFR